MQIQTWKFSLKVDGKIPENISKKKADLIEGKFKQSFNSVFLIFGTFSTIVQVRNVQKIKRWTKNDDLLSKPVKFHTSVYKTINKGSFSWSLCSFYKLIWPSFSQILKSWLFRYKLVSVFHWWEVACDFTSLRDYLGMEIFFIPN